MAILKGIFDNLSIPADERTYAISLYEHNKCFDWYYMECTEIGPHAWALETVDNLYGVIGEGTGARVVAVEMGLSSPVDPAWTTEEALESLVWIFQNRGIEGGSFWRWTDFQVWEEFDPELSMPVKYRSWTDRYTPVAELLTSLYTVGQSDDPMNTPDGEPPVFGSVLASPAALVNGGTLSLTVDLGETHAFVTVDPDPLDDGSQGRVVLIDQGDGTYTREIPISLWNTRPNGVKTLTAAGHGFLEQQSRQPPWTSPWRTPRPCATGSRPRMISAARPSICASGMNTWVYGGGTLSQDGRLAASTGTELTSSAHAQGNWVFPGDFDVEVEFEIGPGWGQPASGHLGGATFGVMIDGELYQETRIRRVDGDDKFMTWSSDSDPAVDPEEALATGVLTGRYRLLREGTRLIFLFDIGDGWVKLGEATVPAEPAIIYMGVGSNDVSHPFTTYFDNFVINAGLDHVQDPFFPPPDHKTITTELSRRNRYVALSLRSARGGCCCYGGAPPEDSPRRIASRRIRSGW